MEKFIKINNTLVNTTRLLAVHYKPATRGGTMFTTEHYLAVFDTGKELRLSPEDGAALVEGCQNLLGSPSEGMIATTSDSAT